MKIPLIVMARSKCTSPSIYLPSGQWTIRSNHVESYIRILTSDSPSGVKLERDMKLQGNQDVQLTIEEFKDKYIHIYASFDGDPEI